MDSTKDMAVGAASWSYTGEARELGGFQFGQQSSHVTKRKGIGWEDQRVL